MRTRSARWFLVLAVAYLVALALVALWPSPVDAGARPWLAALVSRLHGHGVPRWFGYGEIEFAANIVYFIPLGLLAAYRLRRWWLAVLVGLLVSGLVELAQLVLLPGRHPSLLDVLANTLGALTGALVFHAGRRWPALRRTPSRTRRRDHPG